ncbi:hypothetical protein DM860_015154 [Cuscuta australis]|uniref:Uncharacterized protein n=1 Tax=Cuscuta australis TaxID=267555 RepID=A0A328DCM1_9ASTE|nr:hypothetical protein DM860_015154 [Cuscuta australis]
MVAREEDKHGRCMGYYSNMDQVFPDLDMKYWSISGLSKIGSLVGRPIRTDKAAASKSRIGFARILVELDVKHARFPRGKENVYIVKKNLARHWQHYILITMCPLLVEFG